MEEQVEFKARKLSRDQAKKIAEMASSIYIQGQKWVMSHMNLSTGVTRLARGLSHSAAKRKLSHWRKEKVEELLREEAESSAYLIRRWEEYEGWNGGGVWHWEKSVWYTTKEEADKACATYAEKQETYEVYEMKTAEVPGSFQVS